MENNKRLKLISPVAVLDADGALPLEDDPRNEDVLFRRYVPPAQGGPANATCSAFCGLWSYFF